MSFEPRIYGSAGNDRDYNLMPWICTDKRGNRAYSGGRILSSDWTEPHVEELSRGQLTYLLTDGDVRIAAWEPVYTPSGILYATVWQERIVPPNTDINGEE